MAEHEKTFITKQQVEQRIYSQLRLSGRRLHRTASAELQIIDSRGAVVVQNVDYDSLVRELGVVRPWEQLKP